MPKISDEKLKSLIFDFVKFFDIDSKVSVEEKDGAYYANIDSLNGGRLIGKMGETLRELQYLLRMAASKQAGENVLLTVDVASYKQKKTNELEELAKLMAKNVADSKFAQEMKPMSSFERRVVHAALNDRKDVKVFSVGDGMARRIRIEPV